MDAKPKFQSRLTLRKGSGVKIRNAPANHQPSVSRFSHISGVSENRVVCVSAGVHNSLESGGGGGSGAGCEMGLVWRQLDRHKRCPQDGLVF